MSKQNSGALKATEFGALKESKVTVSVPRPADNVSRAVSCLSQLGPDVLLRPTDSRGDADNQTETGRSLVPAESAGNIVSCELTSSLRMEARFPPVEMDKL